MWLFYNPNFPRLVRTVEVAGLPFIAITIVIVSYQGTGD